MREIPPWRRASGWLDAENHEFCTVRGPQWILGKYRRSRRIYSVTQRTQIACTGLMAPRCRPCSPFPTTRTACEPVLKPSVFADGESDAYLRRSTGPSVVRKRVQRPPSAAIRHLCWLSALGSGQGNPTPANRHGHGQEIAVIPILCRSRQARECFGDRRQTGIAPSLRHAPRHALGRIGYRHVSCGSRAGSCLVRRLTAWNGIKARTPATTPVDVGLLSSGDGWGARPQRPFPPHVQNMTTGRGCVKTRR